MNLSDKKEKREIQISYRKNPPGAKRFTERLKVPLSHYMREAQREKQEHLK